MKNTGTNKWQFKEVVDEDEEKEEETKAANLGKGETKKQKETKKIDIWSFTGSKVIQTNDIPTCSVFAMQ